MRPPRGPGGGGRKAAKHALRRDPSLAMYGLSTATIDDAKSELQFHPTVRIEVRAAAQKIGVQLPK